MRFVLTAQGHALAPLPGFDASHEDDGGDKDNGPFPRDALLQEDIVIDDGDVKDGDTEGDAENDGKEEELVGKGIKEPLVVPLVLGVHPEEASSTLR